MINVFNYPGLVFLLAFVLQWLAVWAGDRWRRRQHDLPQDARSDFSIILAATLTLLGLIIGFSFSMATARYDLRKSYEEAEANAIGTEYLRADLLPAPENSRVRDLLRQYVDLRISFYKIHDSKELQQINDDTTGLQNQLWAAVAQPANDQPNASHALAASGMNDVINSQGYTQAAWWNRIPTGAWLLMFVIALFCNALLGFGSERLHPQLFMVLPLVISISFFLIADIDSPRGGAIHVQPQNLYALRAGFPAP